MCCEARSGSDFVMRAAPKTGLAALPGWRCAAVPPGGVAGLLARHVLRAHAVARTRALGKAIRTLAVNDGGASE